MTKIAHFIGKRKSIYLDISSIMSMEVTYIVAVALAATLIVVVLALVLIIIYQRWRIGDQNVFIERFIRQNEEMRKKMRKERY